MCLVNFKHFSSFLQSCSGLGRAAKPPNLRNFASGNTQYKLTQASTFPGQGVSPLTPTGRCTPVPSTKGLHPSVLPPEKTDGKKDSQSAFPVFEAVSLVAFFKKKKRCISLLRKTHRFFALIFIAWFYCCIIPAGSGNLAAMHRGTETFSLSLRTLQQSNRPGFLLQSPCQMLYAEADCQP